MDLTKSQGTVFCLVVEDSGESLPFNQDTMGFPEDRKDTPEGWGGSANEP